MRITRSKPQSDFVIIPNAALEDRQLSWKACGLLAYLLSRPDGWSIDAERLARSVDKGQSKRTAVLAGLRELETAGYLVRTRTQGSDGRWRTEQAIYDTPQAPSGSDPDQLELVSPQVAPKAGRPTSVRPTSVEPTPAEPTSVDPTPRDKTEKQDGGGARAPRRRPSPAPEATHGGRHEPGNPDDLACPKCRDEKVAAAAAAVEEGKRRERQRIEAERAARTAELAAGTAPPPGIAAAYRQQRATRGA